jgi:hypothetical protein
MERVEEPEVLHGIAYARKYLRRIDPMTWSPERVQWLWQQTLKEDYACDDIGAGNPELFISNLFLGNTRHYEFGDDAYIALLNIIPRINADIHFAMWGDVSIPTIVDCHTILAEEMFGELEVNRLTAYIPSFNKKMLRFATILGYRYEGEIRQIFLKNGTYHNLYVYGLLKSEFVRRKVGVSFQPPQL